MYVKRLTKASPTFQPETKLQCLILFSRGLLTPADYTLKLNQQTAAQFTALVTSSEWMPLMPLDKLEYDQQHFTRPITLEARERVTLSVYPENDSNWEFSCYLAEQVEDDLSPYIKELTHSETEPNYCTSASTSACPIDPETGTPMSTCMTWRRRDDLGASCRSQIPVSQLLATIEPYCTSGDGLPDCRCYSRTRDENYQKVSLEHQGEDDRCWYKPCRDGAYLVEDPTATVKCGSEYCHTPQVGEDFTGSKIYSNSKGTTCTQLAEQAASKPSRNEEPKQPSEELKEEPKQEPEQPPEQEPKEEPKQPEQPHPSGQHKTTSQELDQRRRVAMIIVFLGSFFIVSHSL